MDHIFLLGRFGQRALHYGRILASIRFVYNLIYGGIECLDLLEEMAFHVPTIKNLIISCIFHSSTPDYLLNFTQNQLHYNRICVECFH